MLLMGNTDDPATPFEKYVLYFCSHIFPSNIAQHPHRPIELLRLDGLGAKSCRGKLPLYDF